MPVTPYHFGPALAVKAVFPRRFGFLAFAAANVIIDIEPLYYMLTYQYPLHRFFHTLPGAALAAVLTGLLFAIAQAALRRIRQRRMGGNPEFQPAAFWLGAWSGALSHVLLDSLVHADVHLFAPLSSTNPLWGLVSHSAVVTILLVCAAAALPAFAARVIYKRWQAGKS